MTLPDLLADEGCVYNVLLIGETGSGKTTLLNMLVNYFRGDPHARTQLPSRQILKLAVPTSFLEATEPEGTQQTERDISDSKLAIALILCQGKTYVSITACYAQEAALSLQSLLATTLLTRSQMGVLSASASWTRQVWVILKVGHQKIPAWLPPVGVG